MRVCAIWRPGLESNSCGDCLVRCMQPQCQERVLVLEDIALTKGRGRVLLVVRGSWGCCWARNRSKHGKIICYPLRTRVWGVAHYCVRSDICKTPLLSFGERRDRIELVVVEDISASRRWHSRIAFPERSFPTHSWGKAMTVPLPPGSPCDKPQIGAEAFDGFQ
jgi:hypothetical protein